MQTEYSTGSAEKNSAATADACNTASPFPRKPVYDFIKRLFDIVFSLAAAVILLLPCAVISVLIKVQDGGKVLYAHKRIGKNGKPIMVYKFRSMRENADSLENTLTCEQIEEYKKEYKLKNDPRVTPVGKFLRKTSLDELPQIYINILFKGNMSFVGPRPVMQEETLLYGEKRSLLLSVKPGLTGYWAAYAGKNDGYLEGKRQKMEQYYVENRSFLLDMKIIFATVGTVIRKAKD